MITLFEIKSLAKKMDVFQDNTKTKKQLMLVMITANGLKQNLWSEDLINGTITLKELFCWLKQLKQYLILQDMVREQYFIRCITLGRINLFSEPLWANLCNSAV